MAEYLIQGETLTGIANAIRGKTGRTGPVAVSDMAAQIEGIQAGGGDIDALVERTLTEFTNSQITTIGDGAFNLAFTLESVNVPNVTKINQYAFSMDNGNTGTYGNLRNISAPKVVSLGSCAFERCGYLTSIEFPELTTFSGSRHFSNCIRLKTVSLPKITSLPSSAFANATSLETVYAPNVVSIGSTSSSGNNVFYQCSSLVEVDFPLAEIVGNSAFYGCVSLVNVNIPEVTTIAKGAFSGSNTSSALTKLETLRLPKVTSIGKDAFKYSALATLRIERIDGVCSLASTTAFSNTPIGTGTGYIYVPSALIEQYKVATNWSTYAAQFRSLEDHTVDGTVTGELDPAKTGT